MSVFGRRAFRGALRARLSPPCGVCGWRRGNAETRLWQNSRSLIDEQDSRASRWRGCWGDFNPAAEPSAPLPFAAFSPNLYAWMRRHAHFYREGGVLRDVWRVRAGSRDAGVFGPGTLLVGFPTESYPGDADFVGTRLMSALCLGVKAQGACYVGLARNVDRMADFWKRYLEVGRCTIDGNHRENFIGGDRFAGSDDVRTCLWCGQGQRRTRVRRIVEEEV